MPDQRSNILEGQLERITFRNSGNHFMIAKFRAAGISSLVTVRGHFPELRPGETLRIEGRWASHPRYGQQFEVSAFEVLLPAGVEEIRRETFLASLDLARELLHGLGLTDSDARRVTDTFREHDVRRLYDEYKLAPDDEKLRERARAAAEELERLFHEDDAQDRVER